MGLIDEVKAEFTRAERDGDIEVLLSGLAPVLLRGELAVRAAVAAIQAGHGDDLRHVIAEYHEVAVLCADDREGDKDRQASVTVIVLDALTDRDTRAKAQALATRQGQELGMRCTSPVFSPRLVDGSLSG